MSLTGGTFYYLLIAAAVLAVLATLLIWGKVRGPAIMKAVQRVVLVVLCQVLAVAVAGTWVNNHYGLYASWSDLVGTGSSGALVMSGPPPRVAKFTPAADHTVSTFFRGQKSRLAGEVFVWTPPQYHQAAYRKTRFPVIELLHGVPGEPQNWLVKHWPNSIAQLMRDGQLKPAIVVMPVIDPGGVSTDCSNTPQIRGATWLADDVTSLIKQHFRTLSTPRAWSLVGLSTGGFCAIKLAMQYPKTFGIGAGMSPDPFTGDPTVLQDTALRVRNSPIELAKSRPPVQLFAATTAQDKWSPPSQIDALSRAVRSPTVMAPGYVMQRGGHNWNSWQLMQAPLFAWLNGVLAAPSRK